LTVASRTGGIVAIVPARGRSKGIPRKNLIAVDGLSLAARAILCGRSAGIETIILSTDDQEIADEGRRHGALVPGLRPAHLASDTARTLDVVNYVVAQSGLDPRLILLLQPTAPLRRSGDVIAALSLLEQTPGADAVVSITRANEPHPLKMKRVADGWVAPFVAGSTSESPRQSLEPAFRLNGAIYLLTRQVMENEKTLLPKRTAPLLMPAERSINIDEPWDLVLLEALLARGEVAPERFSA
jgi:CMP-N-acetylneuraminic acid synthetase